MGGLLIAMVLGIFLVGGCVSFLPSFSPRGTLFGVTIGRDFRNGDEARGAIGAFRRINLAMTVVFTITLLAVASVAGRWVFMLPSVFILAQFGVATVAFAYGHKKMLKFAVPVSSTRTASLAPRNRTLSGGPLLFAGPFLLVTLAFFAIWAHRSILSSEAFKAAMGSLLVAAFAATLLLMVAALGMFKTRNGHPAGAVSGHGSTTRITYFSFLFVAYVMTGIQISMALSAADLITRTAANRAIVASLVVWTIGTLVLIVVIFRFRARNASNGPIPGDVLPMSAGNGE